MLRGQAILGWLEMHEAAKHVRWVRTGPLLLALLACGPALQQWGQVHFLDVAGEQVRLCDLGQAREHFCWCVDLGM